MLNVRTLNVVLNLETVLQESVLTISCQVILKAKSNLLLIQRYSFYGSKIMKMKKLRSDT
jgi:hypothetical protein